MVGRGVYCDWLRERGEERRNSVDVAAGRGGRGRRSEEMAFFPAFGESRLEPSSTVSAPVRVELWNVCKGGVASVLQECRGGKTSDRVVVIVDERRRPAPCRECGAADVLDDDGQRRLDQCGERFLRTGDRGDDAVESSVLRRLHEFGGEFRVALDEYDLPVWMRLDKAEDAV